MKVKQFFDPESSTYTYILYDEQAREAIIIDPVKEQFERDSQWIHRMGLKLRYVLDTHVHADHITAAILFRNEFGAKLALSKKAGNTPADIAIDDGQEFNFGESQVRAIATPGHTSTCTSFYADGAVFTGDTLLIDGCGRTDFQEGDSSQLYDSVHERLYSLPDNTIVYPGHDYKGRMSSSIGFEKKYNSRLNTHINKQQFIEIMNNLNLAEPKKIKEAVPANLKCGTDI